MLDQKWTDKEKKIARRAFDASLERERGSTLAEFKQMAASAHSFDDLWSVHAYLEKTQRSVDYKYDYRYSQLIFVFANLVRVRRLTEAELEGLSEEEMAAIQFLLTG